MQILQLFEDMPRYTFPASVETVYAEYPRKVGKPEALTQIHKAIKKHGYQHVFDRTRAFAERFAQTGKSLAFVPYPATFYAQERYNDDLDAVFPVDGVARPAVGPSVAQQIRAAEKLLEENRAALARLQMPNEYQYHDAARYRKDLEAAMLARNRLKEARKFLQNKLSELQRRLIE
jgi:hypothetical protein